MATKIEWVSWWYFWNITLLMLHYKWIVRHWVCKWKGNVDYTDPNMEACKLQDKCWCNAWDCPKAIKGDI